MDHSKLLPYTSSHNINRETSAIMDPNMIHSICHWSTSLQIVDGDTDGHTSDGNIIRWNLRKTDGDD